MGKVRIVTDSSAQFIDQSVIQRFNITVVPLEIRFGTQSFREGIDIDAESFFRRVNESVTMPEVVAPSVDTFADVYAKLNRETDQILSIHLSRSIHNTWSVARAATQTLLGRCEIAVLDSQTASVGLAMLVEAAARLAETNTSLDEIVRMVRKIIPRVYVIFYVESLDYLRRAGLVSESQAILGAMLGIKPFLTIEEGNLITMEKVRTRPQAIDKLVEFVTEFAGVERLTILQNTVYPTDQTRALQDRLALEFSSRPFPVAIYNPSLATLIGPDAMGIVVLEDDSLAFDGDEDDSWQLASN